MYCPTLQTVVFGGSNDDIEDNDVFPHASSGTSLKTAYEAEAEPKAGTYMRDATGNEAGSWSKQTP
jgi:hypothetical protein